MGRTNQVVDHFFLSRSELSSIHTIQASRCFETFLGCCQRMIKGPSPQIENASTALSSTIHHSFIEFTSYPGFLAVRLPHVCDLYKALSKISAGYVVASRCAYPRKQPSHGSRSVRTLLPLHFALPNSYFLYVSAFPSGRPSDSSRLDLLTLPGMRHFLLGLSFCSALSLFYYVYGSPWIP
ncbi:hypothetical protein B0T19DRAFT_241136 [Cercophora scortea]|uniref:Uncharacterized protein n=1 Tax=Cercophora scortea TaxID=314031 RepID=A0AAE0I8Y6_9PEZI|nr:hypothetical protein B0T19DRAFT_241136 [Cercophora scortea]